jgi:general stress protein CsbA
MINFSLMTLKIKLIVYFRKSKYIQEALLVIVLQESYKIDHLHQFLIVRVLVFGNNKYTDWVIKPDFLMLY